MPFTLAHPAAVLPLRRSKFLHLAALMVGSITPDLAYYVPSKYGRLMMDSHTGMGAIWPDIPIGLVTLLVAFLLRRPLTVLMSPRARALCLQSMEHFRERPAYWLWAPLAIYIGVWAHILWDAVTHDSGAIVKRVSALSAPMTIAGYTSTVCHVLQYVSSVVGLLILAIWYLRLKTPATVEPPSSVVVLEPARIAILLLVSTIALAVGAFIAIRMAYLNGAFYHVIYLLLTRTTAWFMVLYLGAGLLVLAFRRKPEPMVEV